MPLYISKFIGEAVLFYKIRRFIKSEGVWVITSGLGIRKEQEKWESYFVIMPELKRGG